MEQGGFWAPATPTFIALLKEGQCVYPFFFYFFHFLVILLSFLNSKIEAQKGKKVVTMSTIKFNLKMW